jgi:hypothetical protein
VALRALLAAEAASAEGVCGAALGTGVGGEGDGAWKKLGPDGRRNVLTALCAAGERTIVACGTDVHVYRRAERELLLDGEHTARVRHLLVLGETLLTVCESGVVIVWALANGEVLRRLQRETVV